MSDDPIILRAQGLTKRFGGVAAVDRVDIELLRGARLALIGPNGAGKTTLFSLLAGAQRADQGALFWHGKRIGRPNPQALRRRGLGRTFQRATVFDSLTVRDNIRLALSTASGSSWRPLGGFGAAAQTDGLMERLGMTALAGRLAAALAYGERKRLDLALALAGEPELLLLDEPAAGLAGDARDGLMQAVLDYLAEQPGRSLLFTEHDMDLVFAHAQAVLVMDRGRLIAGGTPAQIAADARVQALYLGEPDTVRYSDG